MIPTLTVRETLLFSANVRLPESTPAYEKNRIVDQTIKILGLSHITESKIGGNGIRGISGGEKRRVSIGVELVTSPSIIFLDEPTSGTCLNQSARARLLQCSFDHKYVG